MFRAADLVAERLSPAVGISIRGEGRVVRHDVTLYGLHRLCISLIGKYPDLETWCELLKDRDLLIHRYTERIVAHVCECFLWLYWKEGANESTHIRIRKS